MKMLKGHNPSSWGGPEPGKCSPRTTAQAERHPHWRKRAAARRPPKINEWERETLARVRLPAIEGHGVLVAHAAAAKDVQGRADGEIDAALAELGHELEIAE